MSNQYFDTPQEALAHFGVKGMKWGQRKSDYAGASRKTNREASKDAKEFARAKMFYGEGAGTRRKLIKASVEAKSKRDPSYQKAFDHHLNNQDLSTHASRARGERNRKDARNKVRKTANAANRAINGPYAGAALTAILAAGVGAVHRSGYDRVIYENGKSYIRQFMDAVR